MSIDVLEVVICRESSVLAGSGAFFFFNDTATTEIYTLSLHDALPIYKSSCDTQAEEPRVTVYELWPRLCELRGDRKSTRLNSSHQIISYAVFCLKKKRSVCKLA